MQEGSRRGQLKGSSQKKGTSQISAFVDYVGGVRPNGAIMQLYYEVLNDLRKENTRDIRAMVDKLDKELYEMNER